MDDRNQIVFLAIFEKRGRDVIVNFFFIFESRFVNARAVGRLREDWKKNHRVRTELGYRSGSFVDLARNCRDGESSFR